MSYPDSSSRGDGTLNSPAGTGMRAQQEGRGRSRQNYQHRLSESEVNVLAECRTDSFYYRSLPFAALAALSTHRLIKMGYLTTGRYGPTPKIGFALFFGYLAGKLSYIEKCKQKFLKLENSEIGEMLRKGKAIGPGLGGIPSSMMMGSVSEENPDVNEGYLNEMNARPSDDPHVNLDIDTSQLRSMDDKMERPESLYQFDNDLNQSQHARPKVTTTYEELRKKNREHGTLDLSKQPRSQQPAVSERGSLMEQPSKGRAFENTGFSKSVKGKVNAYGDTWDE